MGDCKTCVTKEECRNRHKSIGRWLYVVPGLFLFALACAGTSYAVARSAAQDVAVQGASQTEFNRAALDALERIETELRILRNGHGHK